MQCKFTPDKSVLWERAFKTFLTYKTFEYVKDTAMSRVKLNIFYTFGRQRVYWHIQKDKHKPYCK